MQPNILQVFLVWLIPIGIELLIGWAFVATVRRAEARNERRGPSV